MKKNTQNFLLLTISILFISGCATSAKKFKPTDLKEGEGTIVGNIKIMIDGEDFTKHCYVGFNGNNKPYINLDQSGDIIAGSKIGKNELTYITCIDTGLVTVTHSCDWKGAEFINVGDGKQTYFGNIKIDWAPSDTSHKKALTVLMGSVGSALANGTSTCGKHIVTISSNKGEMEKVYRSVDSKSAVELKESLIASPKFEVPVKEQAAKKQ